MQGQRLQPPLPYAYPNAVAVIEQTAACRTCHMLCRLILAHLFYYPAWHVPLPPQ